MQHEWTEEYLAYYMTLTIDERDWASQREAANALAQTALLKFFQYEGCFPFNRREIPAVVIAHLAGQLGLDWDEQQPLNLMSLPFPQSSS